MREGREIERERVRERERGYSEMWRNIAEYGVREGERKRWGIKRCI